jgi:hypothetical protein
MKQVTFCRCTPFLIITLTITGLGVVIASMIEEGKYKNLSYF